MALVAMVLVIGWGLSRRWAIGLVADGWPVTTPWSAVLFGLLCIGSVRAPRPNGAGPNSVAVVASLVACAVSLTLLLQTILAMRGSLETLLFSGQIAELGGRYPGMPSIQTLTTVLFIGSGSLLVLHRRMPRARTILLTTALLTGVSGGMTTAATAVHLRIGSVVYGYSVITAVLTVLSVIAVTGSASDAAPAAIIRTRPLECAVGTLAAGVLGMPAVNLLVDAVSDDGGSSNVVFAAILFFTLALALSWIAWYAMRSEGWRTVAESGTDAMVVLDVHGIIHEATAGIENLTGWTPEELRGKNVSTLVLGPAGEDADSLLDTYFAHPDATIAIDRPVLLRSNEDTVAQVGVRLVPTMEAEGLRVVAMLNDATREAEYRRRSVHDPLTGLLNRAGLLAHLRNQVDQNPSSTAVLFMDVDKFKRINDELSHGAGDEALQTLARNLRAGIRTQDVVGRFGGDEFVCVLSGINDRARLESVAQRIIDAVEPTSVSTPSGTWPVRVSIGAAISESGEDPDHLLSRADGALRTAKELGHNRVEFSDRSAMPSADPAP